MIDLLIAGGGPAGLAAAIRAASLGMEAVVVEPRAAPVDKACGEGIMPSGVAALRGLGVEVSGHPLRGIRYVQGARSAAAAFRGRTGLGVRRTALHTALHTRAVELGVRIVAGKVTDVRQDHDRVRAGGLTARWLIAADGLHSPSAAGSVWTGPERRCAGTDFDGTTASPRGRNSWRSTGPGTVRRT